MKKFWGLLFLVGLASCSSGDKDPSAEKLAALEPEVMTKNLICPQVAVLREAEEVVDYGRETPDPGQLVSKARFVNISGDCGYRKDKDDPTGIDLKFELNATAMKGPRLGGNRVNFPYFVAVVDPSDNVLNRQVLTAKFRFSSGSDVAEIKEPLHVFIPMPPQDLMSGPSYRVLIGFLNPSL